MTGNGLILALAGGVGGAKLAQGLARALPPEGLCIAVNTADDFEHLGLHVSPDLDSVVYALAGMASRARGWGIEGESWNFMAALERLGGETWFKLGDRDLATHVERTRLLEEGRTLSDVTRHLCRQLGIAHAVIPMSDDPVRTVVHCDEGALSFQDYFVRRRCEPAVTCFAFEGAATARPSPGLAAAFGDARLEAVILCPSNPFVSIDPILAVAEVKEPRVPIVAVSPIIGGKAVKGPAAKMMRELGLDATAAGIARHYAGLIDGIVIDEADKKSAAEIETTGVRVLVEQTVMRCEDDKERLARATLAFALAFDRP